MNAYEKINWQDADSTATPLNAENLNHMDNQLDALTDGKADKLPQGSNGVFLEAYNREMRRTDYTATASASQVTSSATNKLLTAAIADEVFARQTELQELEYLSDKVQTIPTGNQTPEGQAKYPSVNAVKGYVDGEFEKLDSVTENPNHFILDSQAIGGITVTNNGDGTYTFDSGGAVTDATVLFPSFLLPAGAYTATVKTEGGSSEAYSGGGSALVAIKFGTGDGETWLKADDDPASKTFAADTIIFFRLNRGTYNNLKLKISITKNDYITAVDKIAREANGFTQEQLKILNGKYSAQENAFYPLAEPDGFTWKNSPLHGKILTDFRGNYQVDFDVSNCKNPIGKAYYIAPNGSDSNDGTPGAPFASISKAYTEGADTIYLYPGIYDRTQTLYTPTTGSNSKPITRNINIIGLGSGAILSTKVVNIVNISEYPTEGTGVWECYANSTTYLTNVVDIKNKTADGHFTKYTQLSSVSAVQAAAGSWALVNGKAYIHTIDGNKPVNGDNVLFLHSTNPTFANNQYTVIYPLFYVTGGKVYFENLTCIEGTTPLFVQSQANGSDIEIYAKNCKFFYSRTEDHDVCMLQSSTLSIFQNCEASFGMKDGFNYHARNFGTTANPDFGVVPKAVEINCIGIGNGNISDGNDQGSTIHDGGSIIRVRDVCAHNYGANYSDQGTGTESWNIGCVGFESWCPSNGQNADFFALLNTKMFLDGCVSFGSKHNFNYASPDENSEDEAGAIYLRCMVENVANKVASISSNSTDEQYPSAKLVYTKLDTKENKSNKVTSLSSDSTNTQYPSAKLVYTQLNTKENKSNKVTSITSDSTDEQYPSAKAVYAAIQAAIESLTN